MIKPFLPSWVYTSADIAARERDHYATCFWHPLTSVDALPDGHVQSFTLLKLPVLLTRSAGVLHAFINRCPHRGVALHPPEDAPSPCRRLVCPYHGWTYDLQGRLLAAARESDFVLPFERAAWPLPPLQCRELGGLIWVAIASDPLPLESQLDLVLQEAEALFLKPRQLLSRKSNILACNWKIAHDNTLDDYHVAIAHPKTLHREQGPVRLYRHALSPHASLLATPFGDQGEFLTFGLAPWTHLLLWPDGRLALIQFEPLDLSHCRMEVWLLGDAALQPESEAWMAKVQIFLDEDRRLVEAAQLGYTSGLVPGPPHWLEQRILQHQSLYAQVMGLGDPVPPLAATAPRPC